MFTSLLLFTTGLGRVIGAPLILHSANGIREGTRGIITGDRNQSGFLKDAYKSGGRELAFDETVGELAYNLIDLGVSVHGKFKLIPKLKEYGNPIRKLFCYGRKDLEMAYKQMGNKLLATEVLGDVISLYEIAEKVNNLFILDKEVGQVNMVISHPKNINNVGEIVEDCTLYIKITGQEDSEPAYYSCTNFQ